LSPDDAPSLDLVTRLRQRWWLVVAVVVVALLIATAYLALATPAYRVTAILMAESADGKPVADFLAGQRRALLSPPAQTQDVAHFYPAIGVEPADRTLTINIETDRPRDAAAALSSMLDAYLKTAGNNPASVAQKLTELAAQREKLAAERNDKSKELAELRKSLNASGTGADVVAQARREQLTRALADAQTEAQKAQAQANTPLPTDPVQRAAFIDAARARGLFKDLEQQRVETKNQLEQAEAQLAAQQQTYLPQHPAIAQTRKKIDQLKARQTMLENEYPRAYQETCQKQLAAAQKKLLELQGMLAQQTQRSEATSDGAAKIAQLEAEVKQADVALAAADQKLREATVATDNTTALKLVQPPQAPDRPAWPRTVPVMLAAGAAGLIAGLALALAARR
jgi:uncharacterized protein involved in exopolysaccharide biosynthesis